MAHVTAMTFRSSSLAFVMSSVMFLGHGLCQLDKLDNQKMNSQHVLGVGDLKPSNNHQTAVFWTRAAVQHGYMNSVAVWLDECPKTLWFGVDCSIAGSNIDAHVMKGSHEKTHTKQYSEFALQTVGEQRWYTRACSQHLP
eukprot:3135450-Amphidinium_carterae.2